MDNDTLTVIIKLAKQKDSNAFRQLVEYYQDFAFSLAFKLVYDEDEAKDIVQDSFIRVWKHISKFDLKTKFTTWLYKIVYNMSLDKIKSNNRRKAVISNCENISDLANKLFNQPEADHINKNLAEIIHVLANDLSPKQHAVFVLRDLQGAEIEDIKEITSMTMGAVKSNLYYARLNIREKLRQMENIII